MLAFTFSTVSALIPDNTKSNTNYTEKISMINNKGGLGASGDNEIDSSVSNTLEAASENSNVESMDSTANGEAEVFSESQIGDDANQGITESIAATNNKASADEHEFSRFIIKYKNQNKKSKMSSIMAGDISEVKKLRHGKFEIVSLKNKLKQKDFLKKIKAKKADTNIEYIQPDYTLAISSDDNYIVDQWGLQNSTETFSNIYNKTVIEAVYNSTGNNSIFDSFSGLNNGVSVSDSVYEEVYNGAIFRIDANVFPAWEYAEGEGVVVAVPDTGIDITHEDLCENIWVNKGEIAGNGIDDDGNGYIDDVNGWNFSDNVNSIHNINNANDEWHGTHIAGIIAANNDNKKGIAGIAPKAQIMPLEVFKNGTAYTGDIIKAIEYAKDNGAKIVNCSWGTTAENIALKEAMEESGLLFVCAAGNSNNDIDLLPVYPSAFETNNVISVASMNRIGQLSGFSNYGPKTVDVAAPGECIMSTLPDNRYGLSSGTSMSAAFVTGEAALLLSKCKDLDSIGIKEKIIDSSDSLYTLLGKIAYGRKINCFNAVSGENRYKDKIIAFSGADYQDTVSSYVYNSNRNSEYELFSVASWSAAASMQTPRSEFGTVSLNGKLYVIGGLTSSGYTNAVEEYDPVTNTWTSKAPINTARAGLCAVAVNGKLYAIGGKASSGYTSIVEEYDPTVNTWVNKTSMPAASGYSAGAVLNGKIYIIGGRTTSGYLNRMLEYDPIANTFIDKAVMDTQRERLTASVVNGKIYAIGGSNTTILKAVEEYNPSTNTWANKQDMTAGRTGSAAVAVNKRIYVMAGNDSVGYKNAVEEFNPDTNSWIAKPSLMSARSNIGAGEVNGTIYVVGGTQGSTSFLKTAEEYYVPGIQFQYDSGNRLRYVLKNGNILATYDYDSNGNQIKRTSSEIPFAIIVNGAGEDWLSLRWTQIGNATSYELYKDGVLLTTTTSNSYTVTSLQPNTLYRMQLKAKKGTEILLSTDIKNIRTAPTAPSGLAASSTETRVTLTWNAQAGVTKYVISKNTIGSVAGESQTNSFTVYGLAPGANYTFYVQSYNGLYSSGTPISIRTKDLAATANLTVTSGNESSISVEWNSIEGAAGYKVYLSGQYKGVTSSTSYTITSLQANTAYTVEVSGYYGSHEGPKKALSIKTAPAAPAGLAASSTATRVTLTWNVQAGATKYVISKDTTGSVAGESQTNSFTVYGLVPGTNYTFYVQSYNGLYSSRSQVSIRTKDLAATANLIVTGGNENSISVEWNSIEGAVGYKVYLNGQYKGVTSTRSYKITGLQANTAYTVEVSGYYGSLEGPKKALSIKTALTAPVGLSATSTAASATLTWNAQAGATKYVISKNTIGSAAGESQTNSSTVYGLAPGTNYTFYVQSYNGLYSSGSPISVRTKDLLATSSLSVTNGNEKSLTVSWSSIEGAAGYKVYLNGQYKSATSSTSYTITSLQANTTYNVEVSGYYGSQEGPKKLISQKTAPMPPTNFVIVWRALNSASFTWNASAGATKYYIYQELVNGELLRATTTSTSVTIGGLPNGYYTFYVRAYNGLKSNPSNIVTIRKGIPLDPNPTPPPVEM